MRQVAERAGVSIKTVSNVLNGYPYVSDQTRALVEAAVSALAYQPNVSARGLRLGRTGAISLVLPQLDDPSLASLAAAISRKATGNNLNLFIELTDGVYAKERQILESPRMRMADGILLLSLHPDPAVAEILSGGTPLVMLSQSAHGALVDSVTIDTCAATLQATEHLISLGKRDIALLNITTHEGSPESRLAGYLTGHSRSGHHARSELIVPMREAHQIAGNEATGQLLASTAFDAVIASNDALALGAVRAINEFGLNVPQDVAVVGFGNGEEARAATPPLTSVDPDHEFIADAAVEFLMARLDGDTGVPRQVIAPGRLIPRGSTLNTASIATP